MHASSVTVLGKNVELRISSRAFMNKGYHRGLGQNRERKTGMDGWDGEVLYYIRTFKIIWEVDCTINFYPYLRFEKGV